MVSEESKTQPLMADYYLDDDGYVYEKTEQRGRYLRLSGAAVANIPSVKWLRDKKAELRALLDVLRTAPLRSILPTEEMVLIDGVYVRTHKCVRAIGCPHCKVKAGELCRFSGYPTASAHPHRRTQWGQEKRAKAVDSSV